MRKKKLKELNQGPGRGGKKMLDQNFKSAQYNYRDQRF